MQLCYFANVTNQTIEINIAGSKPEMEKNSEIEKPHNLTPTSVRPSYTNKRAKTNRAIARILFISL